MQRYAEKRLQEEKEIKDLVQQVAGGHKNSKAAKEKLQKLKQSIGAPPQAACQTGHFTCFFLLFTSMS